MLERAVAARYPRFLDELATLVNIDCGSYTPAGVNRVADFVATQLTEMGATVERIPHQPAAGEQQLGDLVIGRLTGEGRGSCSSATWTPSSTPAPPPPARSTIDGERATGPGVSDMKGGLLAGLHALAALQQPARHPNVTFVANPDEEIGSPFCTPHIRRLAADHDAALVTRVRPRQRRHRQRPQGDRRLPDHASPAAPRTPASSRRRGAARSSRRRARW